LSSDDDEDEEDEEQLAQISDVKTKVAVKGAKKSLSSPDDNEDIELALNDYEDQVIEILEEQGVSAEDI